jgi:outer membrane biosynthesis protein TonB
MRKSTLISAALHSVILLFALVAFPAAKMDRTPLIAIPIDLATPSEITKIKAGNAKAKDEAPLAGKPEEKKPEAVREVKPEKTAELAPEPELKPEPKPKPEPKKTEKPEPKKAQAKKPEPKPAKPKKEAAKKKPVQPAKKRNELDTDRIAALLNKVPDAANAPTPVVASEEPANKVHGQSNGTADTMSVNEIDALRARIAQCWSPPPGGLGADRIVVQLRLKLNEDGTLVGYPAVANRGSSPFFQAAADSAVRAVYQCQPYALPSEKYALWRDMILNFDPSEMYRAG